MNNSSPKKLSGAGASNSVKHSNYTRFFVNGCQFRHNPYLCAACRCPMSEIQPRDVKLGNKYEFLLHGRKHTSPALFVSETKGFLRLHFIETNKESWVPIHEIKAAFPYSEQLDLFGGEAA